MERIKVIYIDTNKMTLDDLLSSSYLNKNDLDYLSTFKVERVKKEKTASRILKNKYVGDYYLDEHDKPISDNTYFNVSHSHGFVVFTKHQLPIGIDVELIREIKKELLDFISSKEEKEYIKDDYCFYEVWTTKEALSKNVGIGLKTNIKAIPALPIDGIKEFNNKKYYSKSLKHENYLISVSLESSDDILLELVEEKL